MKVALVNPNRYLEPPVIPVGLEYLVAPLELFGHSVAICDLAFSDDPAADLVSFLDSARPDVIGFTVRNVDNVLFNRNVFFLDEIASLVRIARECAGAPVVAGGASTLCSVEGLRRFLEVDCLVAGPGEKAFGELLETVSRGAPLPSTVNGWRAGIIPDIAHRRGELVDYAPYLEGGNPAGLEFRKGCDWGCGFCIERARPIMKRETSSVVAEALGLSAAGVEMFFFCDSEVNLDLADTNALLKALAGVDIGLAWSGYFRPVPFDPLMAHLAARSGCGDLTLSVTSWDLSRCEGPFQAGDVRRFLELCEAEGIKVAVDLLVGYPGEDRGSVERAIAFLASLGPSSVAVNEYIRIYEDTPASAMALSPAARGSILGEVQGNSSMLKPVFFTCVEREWLAQIISSESNFVLADSERTVNYLRVSD